MSRSSNPPSHYDLLVIGSGPAGQKAAVQGAKGGMKVGIVERERKVGGACVHRGTIPSKTLRETALNLSRLKRNPVLKVELPEDLQVSSLIHRMESVVRGHVEYMESQLSRNAIVRFHGRARFLSRRKVEIEAIDGSNQTLSADFIVVATGSRPRRPADIPVDHEYILDSDSILSMLYLPQSLTVLGGGVIASEYASILGELGVRVTMIDRSNRPLRFMDPELTDRFLRSFERRGGKYLGNRQIEEVCWDGVDRVVTRLKDGQRVEGEKMLVALGRVANLEGLNIEAAGLGVTQRGVLEVDEHCCTAVPHIYAAGDVIGPPSLAATSMEQGRRAACHALGIQPGSHWTTIPIGVYTIPEMASVGLSEKEAAQCPAGALVGRAAFDELARGQISAIQNGFLKLVADRHGKGVLGVHIVGEGATELIHLGQMGILFECCVGAFVENIFNFPTMAEAYRVAALDIANQSSQQSRISAVG
ncbi:MAG: Si-specific NAD(P)(+) transhydrogenase [Acidobacteriota bacterium]